MSEELRPEETQSEHAQDHEDVNTHGATAEPADAQEPTDAQEPGQDSDTESSSEPTVEPTPEEQIASLKDQLLRKAAEMDNMRKRQQKERIMVFEQAQAAAIEAFLPVNDDLLRTLQAIEPSEETKAIQEGIELVADKFQGVLEKYGVEAITEKGVPFDVNLHEALMRQPAQEGVPSNQVLDVLENGYKLGERVIRHAKVIVSE
ncbi:MAG: nucleotide exchange factor GrpE [Rhodothermaeota bacterium MED-G64]|nr:MAG: nucleotide exchange factor GrpE [Rhodothermaeota bacterium MED-G64]HBD42178.1 nucleotide exchange factor GrpE [Bacteroidota bacterium]|tara:strand:- start:119 stop:730 length:612 start_codon:yes stop_codon:yes gene_type:complete